MSVSKAEKSRFWVAYFLDNLRVGEIFGHGLLHMTLLPWFVSDRPDSHIIDAFNRNFKMSDRLTVRLGESVYFGDKKKAPVTLVSPSSELLGLHQRALDWFEAEEGRWAVQNPHVGGDFRPHIRHRRGKKLSDEHLNIDNLILVKAKRQEDWQREVVAKVELI